jgi:hypothetical protein
VFRVMVDRFRVRAAIAGFAAAAIAAAAAPQLDRNGEFAASAHANFPGWPSSYAGRPLTKLTLSAREIAFVRDFPGSVGRFSDGDREIIIRWIDAPTRRLHPAADCFRGSGFSIAPMPLKKDAAGAAMSCFRASRDSEAVRVCELIRDDRGQSWPDVSAWYWSGLLGNSRGPWWSFVVAEHE